MDLQKEQRHARLVRFMELEVLDLLMGVRPPGNALEVPQRYTEDGVVRHGSFRTHVTSLMRKEFARSLEQELPREPRERFEALQKLVAAYAKRRSLEIEQKYQKRVVCGA